MEREAEMLLLSLLAALCFIGMAYHMKRRKFYQKNAKELHGEVVSWEKKRDARGNVSYELEVLAEDGEHYHVTSYHAAKYRRKTDVVILVPEAEDLDKLDTLQEQLREKMQELDLDEKQREEMLQMSEKWEENRRSFQAARSKLAILSEQYQGDRRDAFLLLFFGCFFMALAVLWLVAEFM